MNITARHVAAAYEFLRKLPPFSHWGLPACAELSFGVLRTIRWQGDFYQSKGRGKRPRIRVSAARVTYADRLLVVTAHEMVHLQVNRLGKPDTHNGTFRLLATQVCAQLGFDPREF